MALIKSKDTGGAVFSSAYMRIEGVWWTILMPNLIVTVASYADKQSAIDGRSPVATDNFGVSISIETVTRTNLYTALKTLTEFAGAVDDI